MKFALQSLQSQTICYWQNAGFDTKQRGVVHMIYSLFTETNQPVLIYQGECQKYNALYITCTCISPFYVLKFFSLLNLAVCVNEVSKIQA